MAPRIAKSLDKLRSQVNAAYPQRSKISDGWIGDAAHSSRDSDHNPNAADVVQAVDLTHDPAHGFDSWQFADVLRRNQDRRIKYCISNGRIFSSTTSPWAWRKYTGANAHAHHVHISVVDDPALYDSAAPWTTVPLVIAPTTPTPPSVMPPGITDAMRRKMAGKIIGYEVKRDADGHFAIHAPGDGSHEIAGVSSTSNPAKYTQLLVLLRAGRHAELERAVEIFVIDYTRAATGWTTDAGVEFYLRDCIYNRGPVAGARVLQKALGVVDDGEIGPTTRGAISAVSPADLLPRLRAAREAYEIEKYGRRPLLWAGLTNRWNRALEDAKAFRVGLPTVPDKPPVVTPKQGIIAAIGAALAAIASWFADHWLPLLLFAIIGVAVSLIVRHIRRNRE